MKYMRTCSGMAAAVLAVFAATGPASAADEPGGNSSPPAAAAVTTNFKVTSDGWIHYDPLLNQVGASSRITTIQGRHVASGGCETSGGGAASASRSSTAVTYTEEVAFNPKTCTSKVATSTLSPSQARRLDSLAPSAKSSMVSSKGAASNTAAASRTPTQTAATTYSRWLKTSWIDPINITISSQRAGLRWTSSNWSYWQYVRNSFKGCIAGVCLDKTYIVSGSSKLSGISNGWSFNAKVHFRNTSFAKWVVAVLGPSGWAACGFPTSFQADFYHSDTVNGYKDGAAAWNWSDSKSGACTNLVHHGSATGTTFS